MDQPPFFVLIFFVFFFGFKLWKEKVLENGKSLVKNQLKKVMLEEDDTKVRALLPIENDLQVVVEQEHLQVSYLEDLVEHRLQNHLSWGNQRLM